VKPGRFSFSERWRVGRIAEKGLDYFPLDTTWETAVKLVKAKFGACKGAGFLAELWASIYRENYYRTWNEETELLFADEIKEEVTWVHEAIEYCFDKQIFDRSIFKAMGVLTGRGIQKRYFRIARDTLKRTCLDYIEGVTYPKYMPKNIPPENKDILRGNADNLGGNADRLHGKDTARKGKERKGIEGEQEERAALVDNFSETEGADLYAFALARVLARKKKPGDPDAMAKSIMHEPDVFRDFRASRTPPASTKTTSVPKPDPCPKCAGEISYTSSGVGACQKCKRGFTYDSTWGWAEDVKENSG
jgi:hypothetical protein